MARMSKPKRLQSQLAILRLAAVGMDVRKQIPKEHMRMAPSLAPALIALDEVLRELGWADANERAPRYRPTARNR